jgi:hypothetical protein
MVGSAFPEDYKQIWHSEQWANGGSNYVGFGTPESDKLIDSIRVQLVDSLRHPMERKLMSIIYGLNNLMYSCSWFRVKLLFTSASITPTCSRKNQAFTFLR